jgi:DNA repair protein RadC
MKDDDRTGTDELREVRTQYGPTIDTGGRVRTADQVAALIWGRIGTASREHFAALHLDGRHNPIAYEVISMGTATASLVHPREVFQTACRIGTVALIIAHNHPSGDPTPSAEDLEVTQRIGKAGKILGIHLIDHIIVTTDPEVWERVPLDGFDN